MRKLVILISLAAFAAVCSAVLPGTAAAATTCSSPVQEQLQGTVTDPTTGATLGSYDLCATLQRVSAADGGTAVVRVTGTVTDANGAVTGFTQTARVPVEVAQTSCDILVLDIGPIFLDLLGLVVETEPIHLEIRAERGPGNLLGNLLCAIAGLLDPGDPITGPVADLINRIIGILTTR